MNNLRERFIRLGFKASVFDSISIKDENIIEEFIKVLEAYNGEKVY